MTAVHSDTSFSDSTCYFIDLTRQSPLTPSKKDMTVCGPLLEKLLQAHTIEFQFYQKICHMPYLCFLYFQLNTLLLKESNVNHKILTNQLIRNHRNPTVSGKIIALSALLILTEKWIHYMRYLLLVYVPSTVNQKESSAQNYMQQSCPVYVT